MSFSVTVEGREELLNSLTAVQRGLVNLNDLGTWNMVISRFREVEKQHFAAGGNGQSGGFAPLKPAYAKAKARKWGNVPILTASGRMMRSLTSDTGDSVVDRQPQELTIGTSLEYAGYHQTGTSRMPSRKPIDLTPRQNDYILEPIGIKLRQLIANAKLRDYRGF